MSRHLGVGSGVGAGVAAGTGVGVGAAVGWGVGGAVGRGVAVGWAVGSGVAVATGAGVRAAVGLGVRVGAGGAGAPGGLGVGRAVGVATASGVVPPGIAVGSAPAPVAGPASNVVVAPGVGGPVGDDVAATAEAVGPLGGSVIAGTPGSVPGGCVPSGPITWAGIPRPADGGIIVWNARATTMAMTSPNTMPISVWRYRGSCDPMRHLHRSRKERILPKPLCRAYDNRLDPGHQPRQLRGASRHRGPIDQPVTAPPGPNPATGIGSKSRPSAPRSQARAFSPSDGRW